MAAWKQLLVFTLISIFSLISQANFGFYPTRNSTPRLLRSEPLMSKQPTLLYYGGPVISNAKIQVVYWSDYVESETQTGVPGFYSSLTDSDFMDWLDQYSTFSTPVNGGTGSDQHIGRGKYLGAITIKPFNRNGVVYDTEIQSEIQKQIQIGALPQPDENMLYMIYFPPMVSISAFGMSSCVDFCAYHSSHGSPGSEHFYYGVMPDINHVGCDQGCAYGWDHFSSLTAISSHEYTEAITDPYPAPGNTVIYPQAWNALDGNEIGDLCAGGNNTLNTPKSSYTVQSEWDNANGNCTNRNWTSAR